MIDLQVHINNSSFTEEAGERLYEDILKAVAVSTEHARKLAREDMRKPKTGNVYKFFGAEHIASAPGESPAVLSGTLINGLSTSLTPTPYEITGKISTSPEAFYAQFLDEELDKPIYRNIENAAEHYFKTQINAVLSRVVL